MEWCPMIKVSDYIAKFFYEKGIRHVFMVTGGGAMHLNDSFSRSQPFAVTFNHHEQASAMAAEGLYRATGAVGLVNVTTGPGSLNALTGLMGQWTDSIPAIYVSGQVKFETTLMSCRDIPLRQLGDQEVDIISLVRNLTKYAVSMTDLKTVRRCLEEAWFLATTGRMGPVWLDVPMNIQGSLVDETDLEPYCEKIDQPQPIDWPALLEKLRSFRRPVIVAGHGVRLSGTRDALLDLLKVWPVPVVTTFNGFDLLPSDHPCFSGRVGSIGTRGGNFTLQNADGVLFLGTRNNVRQASYNWENYAHRAEKIVVDIDPAELVKPTVKPDWAIAADLKAFLPELVGRWVQTPTSADPGWLAWARERTRRYPGARPDQYAEKERLNPYAFVEKWTSCLSPGSLVVAGNGTACVALFQAGVVHEGQRLFWNSGCASMGYDLPAAIGAAAGGAKEVWCLAGDGSLQMNLQELATVSFRKFPIKLIYLNNGGYASIRQTQTNFFGAQYGCGVTSGLGFPDMEKLAAAYDLPFFSSSHIDQFDADFAQIRQVSGPLIWEIHLKLDYSFEPKLSSEKLPDGRMVSKPLEDLYPFLPRAEFEENMIRETTKETT